MLLLLLLLLAKGYTFLNCSTPMSLKSNSWQWFLVKFARERGEGGRQRPISRGVCLSSSIPQGF